MARRRRAEGRNLILKKNNFSAYSFKELNKSERAEN
jgi:hypothetical protein